MLFFVVVVLFCFFGTDAFNDSPDHSDVWPVLQAMTSTDKERED